MPATTALEIITAAFNTAGVFAPGQTIQAVHSQNALDRLKRMMAQLNLQPLAQPVIVRDVFPLVANQGAPLTPYTVGTGGDFDFPRPTDLAGAGLLLVQATPATTVEIERTILTDSGYQAIPIKDLPNSLFTYVYYNPTYTDDWGSVFLYPVPDNAINSIVLYHAESLPVFAALSTIYDLPDGLAEALEYNLARRLLTPYGITDEGTVSDIRDLAASSLATFKRASNKLTDLPNDFVQRGAGLYNITTGEFE